MRTFVMGDIHGAYKALQQCLDRSKFNKKADCLIQLGDIADGHADVYRCVEELLTIDNLIAIQGNHDEWFAYYLQTGIHPDGWRQGGRATLQSYASEVPETHHTFFRKQHLHYIDDNNNCFVHGGFNREQPFKGQSTESYLWDRKLWEEAVASRKKKLTMVTTFKEIFIGHTSTQNWQTDKPMHAANIWNLDTGAGHAGRLTIMNAATKEYWQSDAVTELYEPVRW